MLTPSTKIVAFRAVLVAAVVLALAACGTVMTYAPPGVSQAQLDSDANACERRTAYAPDHMTAYMFCMHMLGYDVRRPDGTLWEGQRQQAYVPQPAPPVYTPPAYSPPPVTEAQPEPYDPSAPPATNATQSPSRELGEVTADQQRILKIFVEEGMKAGAYCSVRAYLRTQAGDSGQGVSCSVERMFEGVYGRVSLADLRGAICSNPDSLQRLPLVTDTVENWIVQKVGC